MPDVTDLRFDRAIGLYRHVTFALDGKDYHVVEPKGQVDRYPDGAICQWCAGLVAGTDRPHAHLFHNFNHWNHYKGGMYRVDATLACAEWDPDVSLVLYRNATQSGPLWARPVYTTEGKSAWFDFVEWPDKVYRWRFFPKAAYP